MSSPAKYELCYRDGKIWCHTSFVERKGSLTWKIPGFSVCSFRPSEFLTSPHFAIVGEEENLWHLRLYPSGKTDENKDFVGVYICSKNRRKISEPVTCELFIVDASSGGPRGTKKFPYISESNYSGWDKFISKSSLSDDQDSLIPYDELTVCCNLTTVRQLENIWTSRPNRPRSFESHFKHAVNTLSRDMSEQYKLGCGCDVALKVGEAKIPAHRAVLSARSGRFADMFKQQDKANTEISINRTNKRKKKNKTKSDDVITKTTETQTDSAETQTDSAETQTDSAETQTESDETQTESDETQYKPPETQAEPAETQTKQVETQAKPAETVGKVETVVIKDVKKKVLMTMLDFIYSDECHLKNVQFTMELLAAADKYCIPQLKTICSDYLKDNLSENNVFDIAQRADSVNDRKLRNFCVEFICRNLSNLIITDSNWKNSLSTCPEVISDILLHLAEKEKRFGNFAVLSTSQSNCNSEPKTTSGNSHLLLRQGQLVWKISGVQLCPHENGRCLFSPEFGISGPKNIKCHLQLYLNGEWRYDGFLSLSLYFRTIFHVSVQYSISIKNTGGVVITQINDLLNFCGQRCYRLDKCVSREELDSRLPNDELVVHCVVGVSKLSGTESLTHTASVVPKRDSQAEDFGRLFESKELADVDLEIETNPLESEGLKVKIAAHKTILRSRSSVLASMLDVIETKRSLSVPYLEEDALRQLIAFLYTDKCYFKNVSNALDIWKAAHQFKVPLLQVKSCKYLREHMSDESVLPIVIVASIVYDENMYKICMDYIFQEVPSFTFLPFSEQNIRSYPDVYNDIRKRFAIKVNVEENR